MVRLGIYLMLLVHYFACTIAILTIFKRSPLDTWLATYGYCEPVDEELGIRDQRSGQDHVSCVEWGLLYFVCVKWALGLIVAQGLPIEPDPGPFEPHFSESNAYNRKMQTFEDIIVLLLKFFGVRHHP